MKIFVAGAKGQLGREVMEYCKSFNIECVGRDLPDFDITDLDKVLYIVKDIKPDLIYNCAAYTAVDLSEKEYKKAFLVNGLGARNLALAARRQAAGIVHISTDAIFDGTKNSPYREDDIPNPVNTYGASKLYGEVLVKEQNPDSYILRTSWLYGEYGKTNFVTAIRKNATKALKEHKPLKVVNDQKGTPTWTKNLVEQTFNLLKTKEFGTYHCSNEGECTWFDFAKEIVSSFGIDIEVLPCKTDEYPSLAKRGKMSVLENFNLEIRKLNIMPHWKEAFRKYCNSEQLIKKEIKK